MITVIELEEYFDKRLDKGMSCEWDNDGLMLCADSKKEVKKALLTLDVTPDAVEYAAEIGADAIFTHHPFIFKPVKSLSDKDGRGKLLLELLKRGISVFSYHTRLDAADGGVNDILASVAGLKNVSKIGEGELALGRIGEINSCTVEEFATTVKMALKDPSVYVAKTKECSDTVKKIAVQSGSCDREFVCAAIEAGADLLLTGDASYNLVLDANIDGLSVICLGHFASENPVLSFFEDELSRHGVETFRFDCGYYKYL